MPELLPDDATVEACEKTGLEDFGPGDYREGLTALCESINNEARLNDLGEVAVRDTVVNSLANRLRVFDWIRGHPEVAGERIDAPIVVIGMFRAGGPLPSGGPLPDREDAARKAGFAIDATGVLSSVNGGAHAASRVGSSLTS